MKEIREIKEVYMSIKALSKLSKLQNQDKEEGDLTTIIENQTAKIPSGAYLTAAMGSMAVSAGLEFFTERKQLANFIGQWVPTILILGLYNKLVKLEGND